MCNMACDMCFQIELLVKELKEGYVIQHDETMIEVSFVRIYKQYMYVHSFFDIVQCTTHDVKKCSDAETVANHDLVRFVCSF